MLLSDIHPLEPAAPEKVALSFLEMAFHIGVTLVTRAGVKGRRSVRVETLPESGLAIPGFSTWDCNPIKGSFIGCLMAWNNPQCREARARTNCANGSVAPQ